VGAEQLVKERFFRGAQVLNSEPSELKLSLGNRGLRIYQASGTLRKSKKLRGRLYNIEFSGRAAHSARPHLGKNALLMALKYLSSLPDGIYPVALNGGLAANITAPRAVLQVVATAGKPPSPKKFGGRVLRIRPVMHEVVYPEAQGIFLTWFRHLWRHRRGTMTHNIGFLRFSGRAWELIFDLRIPIKYNLKNIEQLLENNSKNTNSKLRIERNNLPYLARPNSSLQRRMARILRLQGHPVRTEIKWGGTEASVFGRVAQEVLTFGPGRLHGVAHQPNEYVELRQLYQATLVYRELFKGMIKV
jgi:acetylornithine deacetylase/succinyl-diaminopimelate desuccinylase-like protein